MKVIEGEGDSFEEALYHKARWIGKETAMGNKQLEQVRIGSIKEMVKDIEGWITKREEEFLYRMARQASGKGVIVEIGSYRGKSTIYLAWGAKDGSRAKVYAVDPHTGSPGIKELLGVSEIWTFDEFLKNIEVAGVSDIVVPIVKTSQEAAESWDEPVELIFIDGDHEYKSVETDFKTWFPHLTLGGVMAFHDTVVTYEGPRKVVRKHIYKSRHFKEVGTIDSITFATKVKKNAIKDVLWNRYKLLLADVRHLIYSLPKPVRLAGRAVVTLLGIIPKKEFDTLFTGACDRHHQRNSKRHSRGRDLE